MYDIKFLNFTDPFNGPGKFAYFEEDGRIISMVGLRIHDAEQRQSKLHLLKFDVQSYATSN